MRCIVIHLSWHFKFTTTHTKRQGVSIGKGVKRVEELKKIPTEQLVNELLSRGCLKVNTKVRSPYQLGHKLVQTGYGHSSEIKAQTVLVVPPFSLE